MALDGGLLGWLADLSTGNYIAIASVVSVGLGIALLRQLVSGGVCHSKARLDGKFVIITGANTGIGKETAKDLASRGARVMIACRDPLKAADAADDIFKSTGQHLAVKTLDLADLDSVRQFAESINEDEPRLDILINNAGVMMCPKLRSKQGYELQFATNHLGHFLLTTLLLPLLQKSSPSRVVIVSSRAHRRVMACPRRVTKQGYELQFATNHLGHFLLTNLLKDLMIRSSPARIVNVSALLYIRGKLKFDDINSTEHYDPYAAYAQSKLANILFTNELARRLKGTRVTVNSLHPGVIDTELGRHIFRRIPGVLQIFIKPLFYLVKLLVFKTALQGSQTTIHCAVSEEVEGVTGKYFSDCSECKLLPAATDEDSAKRLWELSEQMVGLNTGADNSNKTENEKLKFEDPECDQKKSATEKKDLEEYEESIAESGSRQTTSLHCA